MRTTKFSFWPAAFGVDVVALFTPAELIADEFNVSLDVALFTFVAVTFGLFAVLLILFRAIFVVSLIRCGFVVDVVVFFFVCEISGVAGQISSGFVFVSVLFIRYSRQ